MREKSSILKSFLATASLCGSLLSSFNAAGALLNVTGSAVLSTNSGLSGSFNSGDSLNIILGTSANTILADKDDVVISGIGTTLNLLKYGGVKVSGKNVSIGALSALVPLNTDFGTLSFTADKASATITAIGTGNLMFNGVDFAGKNSTLQINDNLTIATPIDNTVAAVNGTLNLGNGVTITKDIGGTNSLLAVNINGSGNINFGGIVKAKDINLGNSSANVTATGLVTAPLNYTQGGTFTASAGIKGNIDFKNQAGTFTLADNMTITGNINSTGGVKGTLNSVGGTITGTINNLKLLQCNGGTDKTLKLQGDAI